jgi:hypothetical protein
VSWYTAAAQEVACHWLDEASDSAVAALCWPELLGDADAYHRIVVQTSRFQQRLCCMLVGPCCRMQHDRHACLWAGAMDAS